MKRFIIILLTLNEEIHINDFLFLVQTKLLID